MFLYVILGHKRTGSNAEIIKDDVCDVDIDVYITELTALLRLMQVSKDMPSREITDVNIYLWCHKELILNRVSS